MDLISKRKPMLRLQFCFLQLLIQALNLLLFLLASILLERCPKAILRNQYLQNGKRFLIPLLPSLKRQLCECVYSFFYNFSLITFLLSTISSTDSSKAFITLKKPSKSFFFSLLVSFSLNSKMNCFTIFLF